MNSRNSLWRKWVPVILLAFAGTICIPNILAVTGDVIWYTNSFFSCFFFAFNLYSMNRLYPVFQKTTGRKKTYAVLFAFILSMALHFGSQLEADGYVTFTDMGMWLSMAAFTLYAAVLVHGIWEKLPGTLENITIDCAQITENPIDRVPPTEEGDENASYTPCYQGGISHMLRKLVDTPMASALTIFVLWLPVFLAFFPGAFVYDAQDEYVEVASRIFTTHHPLLHVLLLGVPIRAAEHFGLHTNVGIACYTIFQMLILSGTFGYLFYLLKKWNVRPWYRVASLFFIGLFPIFPMYAVCSAKDTLFTAGFLLILLFLLDYARNRAALSYKKSWTAVFILTSVCMMLLRNNGVYAYGLMIFVLLVCCAARKIAWTNWKKPVFVMLISIALFYVSSHGLQLALHASDSENQELLTVPIQQLARTYTYAPETFTEEEKQTLFEVLSPEALNTYTPKISDIIKSQFNNEAYSANPGKYLSLWAKMGIRKPLIYVNAWFLTSYGYWYPDGILNSYGGTERFTFQYHDSSYFGFETEPPGERHSLFPLLEEFYRNISLELYQQRVPVISMLFSPGFLFWIFAFIWTWLLREKKYECTAILSGVFMLWLTVIAGPTTLVRYLLILWFLLPVLPVLIQNDEKISTAPPESKKLNNIV